MLWLKTFHIVFMVTWFAGLFYLPRIFVYHAAASDTAVKETFQVMERRLLVMTHIGGTLTLVFGIALLAAVPGLLETGWMKLKLVLVVLLAGYHAWCAMLVRQFARDAVGRSSNWFRGFNEFPTLILLAVVLLAVLKPF